LNLQTRSFLPVLLIVLMFYSVGVMGHLVRPLVPVMLAITPWFLLLSGLMVAVASTRFQEAGTVVFWFLPLLLVTFAFEVLGVATGEVFGAYHYTEALGVRIAGVPPVIGWNWVLVVWGVHTAARNWLPSVPVHLLTPLVGVACVAFDFLLEPVATGLGYWVWEGGTVPLRNYLAWGIIAAAGSWWAGRFPKLPSHPLLAWYVGVQAVFFAILGAAGVKA